MPKIAMTTFATFALALGAAVAPAVHASEPVTSEELAGRVDTGGFEFRGSGRTASGFENVIWRFQSDGRVASEGAISRLFYLGGMGEQFGLRGSGTWRRDGNKICVTWDSYNRRFDGCYGVLRGHLRTVHLTGPQFMDGGLDRAAPPCGAVGADVCRASFEDTRIR